MYVNLIFQKIREGLKRTEDIIMYDFKYLHVNSLHSGHERFSGVIL